MQKTDGKKIRKILALLTKAYGHPPVLKKTDAVDELVRTVLSQNTTDKNSLRAFAVLNNNFKSWEGLLKSDTRHIAGLIRHAGLANIKAKRIKEVLAEIKRREGFISLSRLAGIDIDTALEYLKSLKGIGPKTAACVLLFSFGKPVMPVDTHIFRVTRRLGMIGGKVDIKEAHGILSRVVPAVLIYEFHLGIIEHGRKTCKAQNPACGICVLYDLCAFKLKKYYKKRGRS